MYKYREKFTTDEEETISQEPQLPQHPQPLKGWEYVGENGEDSYSLLKDPNKGGNYIKRLENLSYDDMIEKNKNRKSTTILLIILGIVFGGFSIAMTSGNKYFALLFSFIPIFIISSIRLKNKISYKRMVILTTSITCVLFVLIGIIISRIKE